MLHCVELNTNIEFVKFHQTSLNLNVFLLFVCYTACRSAVYVHNPTVADEDLL